MTLLQRLAFERIEKLGKSAVESLPQKCRWLNKDRRVVDVDEDTMDRVKNMLYEQQLWIDALNKEEHS
jgi:hypothetical protein